MGRDQKKSLEFDKSGTKEELSFQESEVHLVENEYLPLIRSLYDYGRLSVPFKPSLDELNKVESSHKFLMKTLENNEVKIYGVHTGYGENVRNKIDPQMWKDTQMDLLGFLKVGVGENLPGKVVRRALKLQAKKVSYGLSGIHPKTYASLLQLSNSFDLPNVPCKGSLGASGDLVSMAHAVAPLFGEEGPRGPRDVIGLVNTNSMMASWAVEHYMRLSRLMIRSYWATALSSITIGCSEESFLKEGLSLGNVHKSYMESGEKILFLRRAFLKKLRVNDEVSKLWEPSTLQTRYSMRCAPQIFGNSEDFYEFAGKKIVSEACSVTDNPLIIGKDGGMELVKAWHGGLFYATGIASSADLMMDVVGKLGEMLDRQILVDVDSNLNGGLPDNLKTPGFGHCKGIHMLLSALCQELRGLAMPSRNMSFSCEGNNQDLVPCGMTVLNNLNRALNAFTDIVRGALFVSLRGALLRCQQNLPKELHLDNWDKFTIQTFDELIEADNIHSIQDGLDLNLDLPSKRDILVLD